MLGRLKWSIIFVFFKQKVCFVVAICYLMHDVEAIFHHPAICSFTIIFQNRFPDVVSS